MLVFYYKIIGDVKKCDGSFEYGSLFYTQRDPKAYTKGSKWWFVKPTDIIRSLQNLRTAQIFCIIISTTTNQMLSVKNFLYIVLC